MTRLTITKERKYLLIGGMILLMIGAVYRFYPYFNIFNTLDDEIGMKQSKILKYQQKVQQRSAYEAQHVAFGRLLERAHTSLLNGKTPALAAVDIQNVLNSIAGRHDVEIKTIRVLKPKESEETDYMTIAVQFDVTSTIIQLKDILYGIESAEQFLRVTSIRIKIKRGKQADLISSSVKVEGFILQG